MKTQVYNLKGENVGEINLPNNIFSRPWNSDLVHQVLRAQLANRRQPWAHAKGRGEVSGGGKKPWRQKHTGRARHGSIRSPIWKGGGVTHGPVKEKKYELKINKKMLRAAIYSALSKKLADNELKIIDSLKLNSFKTKELNLALGQFLKKSLSALLVPAMENKLIYRASRNIPNIKSSSSNALNVYDILKYKNVLIDKEAVPEIK
ncbi:MAG: 50S ribosomal protein L4 [Candidatus Harrisonbacteria bacterium RIFCSPHIGHO2_01_FULL_44_13]|uniref:Large ribosomal subunit protein uL4 n=1 Tax=Candidatus Harrisonbacteria bacterium RIFCSPLOWO2_01_FULL_44_18 TaxID=1798407 RepID=A0A1G1ZN38_9BACT|nr:MAG: 50S ribosomal protein L4 [Candidatus Harrisonbacteria bacterium RIFCSPHIGHO2_01_FULL_44_13]OGY65945.1 MAG: 50S ribosomal protein L4 [Candidatus Harrisonbacteria bacterium RIFCSPLOWO2_01_FULL_44_18]